MDFIDDKKQTFKHYCRVCKKGFMCGRALGGHMRAHGIGDDNVNLDDDYDHTSDSDGGSYKTSNNNKRIYKLRTNPNRLKSCRACENCGKEFLCWKSFLEHGKCSSNDAYESRMTSFESEGGDAGERHGIGWSKRKRSMRSKIGDLSSVYPACEEEDLLLAQCLVQLANTIVEPMPWPEESSSSASREKERRDPTVYFSPNKAKGPSNAKGLFECKACKKVFNSHQALGGHRASHKKVKGCYAAKQDQYDNSLAKDDIITQEELLYPSKPTSPFHCEQGQVITKRKSKVHECSICHRVFSSGQALGGHKRCHWIVSNSQNTSSLAKFQFQDNLQLVHQHQEPQSTNLIISNFQRSLLDPLNYEDGNNKNNGIANKIEDEANSKLQLSKLSDLNDFKEMDTPDNSSQWLQIGFGSTTEVATAD